MYPSPAPNPAAVASGPKLIGPGKSSFQPNVVDPRIRSTDGEAQPFPSRAQNLPSSLDYWSFSKILQSPYQGPVRPFVAPRDGTRRIPQSGRAARTEVVRPDPGQTRQSEPVIIVWV